MQLFCPNQVLQDGIGRLCRRLEATDVEQYKFPTVPTVNDKNVLFVKERKLTNSYSSECNKAHLWETSIYPKMKEAVLSVLLSAKQIYEERNVMTKDTAFELFGADFMLTSDLVPWLIEINSLPLMSAETKVMKELSGNCVTDCIKGYNSARERF